MGKFCFLDNIDLIVQLNLRNQIFYQDPFLNLTFQLFEGVLQLSLSHCSRF